MPEAPASTPIAAKPQAGGAPLIPIDSGLFEGVTVALEARMGEVSMTVAELCRVKIGSVVKLDLQLNEPVTLYLDDAPIARGEIVAIDDHFAVRIAEIAPVGTP